MVVAWHFSAMPACRKKRAFLAWPSPFSLPALPIPKHTTTHERRRRWRALLWLQRDRQDMRLGLLCETRQGRQLPNKNKQTFAVAGFLRCMALFLVLLLRFIQCGLQWTSPATMPALDHLNNRKGLCRLSDRHFNSSVSNLPTMGPQACALCRLPSPASLSPLCGHLLSQPHTCPLSSISSTYSHIVAALRNTCLRLGQTGQWRARWVAETLPASLPSLSALKFLPYY